MRLLSQEIITLADEGCRLHQRLIRSLHVNSRLSGAQLDPYEKLAVINNCASIAFLCKNFTYYDLWGQTQIPRLTPMDNDKLVADILGLTDELMDKSNIPGILFLFPLRVAGTIVLPESRQRSDLIRVLQRIHVQGFSIAGWVRKDVESLWLWEESLKSGNDNKI